MVNTYHLLLFQESSETEVGYFNGYAGWVSVIMLNHVEY